LIGSLAAPVSRSLWETLNSPAADVGVPRPSSIIFTPSAFCEGFDFGFRLIMTPALRALSKP
jgi:hypothetical protein